MNDLLRTWNDSGVRYLLAGGQAMRLIGMPRFSMDWDFFIPPRDERNFERLNKLMAEDLDMPLVPLGTRGENFIQTYQIQWGILQFHLGLPGVPSFDAAETAAVVRTTEHGVAVRCLSGRHLLDSKQAAGRPQDQLDIEFLLELQRASKLD